MKTRVERLLSKHSSLVAVLKKIDFLGDMFPGL